jgi:SAM-dependent methyltransferase
VGEKLLREMSESEIEDAVRCKYSKVAIDPKSTFNFPVGKEFALSVGYPKYVLDRLPDSFIESFTGANNPQPFIELKIGDVVLDLGCGAGLDLYFYAKAVGSGGKVYGIDISEDMVKKAKTNMEKVGSKNIEIKIGHSTDIPLEDSSVNVVASNGIYNLTPDKEAAFREVLRVLKPGGRTVFCEIILKNALPGEIRQNINDWFRCIGGALTEKNLITLMKKSGFEKIELISKVRNARTGHQLAICANIRAFKPK